VNKQILSIFLLVMGILVGCNTLTPDENIPTQIVLPTSEPTSAPTQTAAPTDVPLPQPTDLIIPKTNAVDPNNQAYLRVINASQDLGVVDVYIEALAIGTNLDYGLFTDREPIVAGRYTLRILPTSSFVTDVTLYEEELDVLGGQSLIFVITGTAEALTVTTLNEPNEPLANDTSRLLMINALEGADNVVMLVDDEPQTSTTSYLHISETIEYKSKRADFIFQNNGSTIYDTKLDLRQRQNYIFVILGDTERPDTQQLIILSSDAPGITHISVVNAAQSLEYIDIYLGDELLAEGINFTGSSDRIEYLSGTYSLSLYQAGANPNESEPLTGTQIFANPGEEIVLVLVGEPNNYRFVTHRNNTQPTYSNSARITFINGLESVSNILLRASESDLEHTLGYARLSNTYDIEIDRGISFTWINKLDDVQDIVLEDVSNFRPSPGNNYLYIFAGRGYDFPIIYESQVETLDFAYEETDSSTPVPTSHPTKIRLVNLWEDRQFVVRLDGTTIAEGVEFGKATNQLIIDSGEHTISFQISESNEIVLEVIEEFQAGEEYTVIAFNLINGSADALLDEQGDTLIINDVNTNLSSISADMRMIILEGQSDSLFGVGYSAPTPNIVQPNDDADFRKSLSFGIEQIIRKIPVNEASEVHSIPIGTFNLQIIDNKDIAIAYTHTEYSIEPQTLYNVFLREVIETGQVNTVIVPYSSP
jgi:hypothetical protein